MRRSEAVLLFLFIATAAVYFATRPRASALPSNPLQGSIPPSPAAAATVSALRTPIVTGAQPSPTPAPAPPYFSTAWFEAHPPADVPPVTALGAIVVDRDTQQVLFSRTPDVRRPPASVMKIVTAMVALDSAKPDQVVSISRGAADMEPNKMGLSYGERLTVQELLYGLLLDSGNDAAEALADGLPGGRDQFLRKMNAKAASLGLTDSHFADTAGLDDDNYSTPYDMAVLADAALTGYPTIRSVVATKDMPIAGNANHKWFRPINLNDLLWDYPGTYGVKVGYTDAAQYTIILAAQKDGRNVLTVLLGSQHHFTEGRKLFDWAFGHLPTPDGSPVRKFATNLEKTT